MLTSHFISQLPDFLHCNPICKLINFWQFDGATSFKSSLHGARSFSLYTNHFNFGLCFFDVGRNTRNKATPTYRNKNGIKGNRFLSSFLKDFVGHCSLTSLYIWIIKGIDKGPFFSKSELLSCLSRSIKRISY